MTMFVTEKTSDVADTQTEAWSSRAQELGQELQGHARLDSIVAEVLLLVRA